MQIIAYPHPTLRYESKPILRVDSKLRDIVAEMFTLMYEARGIGLAANQVDLPLRLFITNECGQQDNSEKERVFINPVVSLPKGSDEGEEGCLSLPGLYATVRRPKQIRIQAYDLKGQEINETVDGFLARVIQHEFDHLNGVLFIDRVSEQAATELTEGLAELESEFRQARESGALPDDATLQARREEWEQRYC